MKHFTLLWPFFVLILFGSSGSAEEADGAADGLVLLVDYQQPGQPSNIIRVTIENRSKKPRSVVPPADIKRPWGAGWWYCGSYQFYLHSATLGLRKYVCDTPRPPAAMPLPSPPEIVTLRPGQSIGVLVALPLPSPVDYSLTVRNLDEPLSPPSWKKIDDDGKGKPPRRGYTLTVGYSPVEYGRIVAYPIGSEKNVSPKLSLLDGKKISSNSLRFDVKKPKLHDK